MAFRFTELTVSATGVATTASTNILWGPQNISTYEKFALMVSNESSAVDVHFLQLQVSMFSQSNIGTTGAVAWYNMPTADAGLPSSIVASAGDLTTPIANAYRFIRLIGGVTATAGTSVAVTVTVGGFTRE